MVAAGMGGAVPMGGTVAGLGMPHGVTHAGLGSFQNALGAMPSMGGISGGHPMLSPSMMLPSQYHTSPIFLPQYTPTALSSNTQYSLAHGGEQPYKKLKTS